ncbi:MAG: hypothetical protein KBE65_21660 [Phycisphaerae bacterium]|nr:hypothetical protein [Phycisphaerae bacterium]
MKRRSVTLLALALLVLNQDHVCWADMTAGSLVAWGRDTSDSYNQLDVPTGSDFVAVDTSFWYHGVALRADGTIAAWGGRYAGSSAPISGNDFVAVSAGSYYNLALRADGSLVAVGKDEEGQLAVPSGNDFVAIAAGRYAGLAIRQDGSLAEWGNYALGAPSGNDFVAIDCGIYHAVALREDGSLAVWGLNNAGQLNDVPTGSDFVKIAAGGFGSLALRADGSLAAWGGGGSYVPPGNDFIDIAAGETHALALRSDGSIVGWGDNSYGEAASLSGPFQAISGGSHFTVGITGTPQVVPLPGAALLGVLGVGYASLRLRRHREETSPTFRPRSRLSRLPV